eukprot:1082651-Rhodomonas_salina.1
MRNWSVRGCDRARHLSQYPITHSEREKIPVRSETRQDNLPPPLIPPTTFSRKGRGLEEDSVSLRGVVLQMARQRRDGRRDGRKEGGANRRGRETERSRG